MDLKLYLGKFNTLLRHRTVKKNSGFERIAAFHWKIFLGIFGVAVAGLFFWSFLMYRDIASGEFFVTGKKSESTQKVLDEESIGTIIKTFEKNSDTFKSLRLQDTWSADPSR